VIRVNDLVADFKCHDSPCLEALWEAAIVSGSFYSIAHFPAKYNEKRPENGTFRALSPEWLECRMELNCFILLTLWLKEASRYDVCQPSRRNNCRESM
jgi:hypothetical protein